MSCDEIAAELAALEPIRQRIKAQAMVYQFDLKTKAAQALGLTFDEVNLPYKQWAELRAKYLELVK